MSEQAAIEQAQLEHVSRVRPRQKAEPGRRLGFDLGANETPTGELLKVLTESLVSYKDDLNMGTTETCENWATILLRDLRYGVPAEELNGQGFIIRDEDLGDPPLCESCLEDE